MESSVIRKITIGKDYKNDAMHYSVGQDVYGGHTICDIIEEKPPEKGCCFQGRCPRILGDKCKNETPPWQIGDNGNAIRCHINIKELENIQNGN